MKPSYSRLLTGLLSLALSSALMASGGAPLVQRLVSADNSTRETALQELSAMPTGEQKSLVQSLVALLNKGQIDERERAAEALRELGPAAEAAVPALQKNLSDDFPYVRILSAEALAKIGPAAIPAFVQALKNDNNEVRAVTVQALVKLGASAKPAIPALVETLQDSESPIRRGAASALTNCGADASSALMQALGDPSFKNRIALVRILGEIDGTPPHLTSQLVPFLSDQDAELRLAAVKALARKGAGAVPAVILALSSESPSARAAAAGILGDIGPEDPAEIPALIKLLKDPEGSVRAAAAHALGKMRSAAAEAADALREAAKDPDRDVAARALEALTNVAITSGKIVKEGEPPVPDAPAVPPKAATVPKVLDKPSKPKPAAKKPAKAPSGAAMAKLIKDCSSPDPKARSLAPLALSLKGEQAIPPLLKVLKNKDPLLRQCACEALGDIGPVALSASAALAEALRDPAVEVRQSAAGAYVKVSSATAAETFGALVKAGDEPVRLSALAALEALGPDAAPAAGALGGLIIDSSDTIRAPALRILEKMGTAEAKKILETYKKQEEAKEISRRTTEIKQSTGPVKEAVGSLVKIGIRTLPSVVSLLKEPNAHARLAAAQVLNALGPASARAVPDLLQTLNDTDANVRRESAQALEKINSPQAKNALRWYYAKEKARPVLLKLHLSS